MKKILLAAFAAAALLTSCDKMKTVVEQAGGNSVTLKTQNDTLSYLYGMAQGPSEEQLKMYLQQAGSDSAYIKEFVEGMKKGLATSDDKKKLAHQLGVIMGFNMKTRNFTQVESQVFMGDSTSHIDTRLFVKGFMDCVYDKPCAVTNEKGEPYSRNELQPVFMQLFDRMSKAASDKVYKENIEKEKTYFANLAKDKDVKKLDGGVYYKVLTEGKGAKPTVEQVAQVEYEGRLTDGTVFDASKGTPVNMPVGGVVEGFRTALLNMPVGSEWEVYIPSELGYGAQAQGPIPPYSTLVFKLKLVGINDAPAQPQQPQIRIQ